MDSVAILIPVLDRPHRVLPLIESLEASEASVPVIPVFICSPKDTEQVAEAQSAARAGRAICMVVDWDPGRGDYAKKINYAFRQTADEWVLLAADDIAFRPGWIEAAMKVRAELHPCVIGTNDLGNPRVTSGRHSVYTLVHRDYGECGTIDDETVLLHEGYWHNFVDDEFIQTAMHRETFAFAGESIIEHLHPHWRKAPDDATYQRGQKNFELDRAYHRTRQHLWGASPARRTR